MQFQKYVASGGTESFDNLDRMNDPILLMSAPQIVTSLMAILLLTVLTTDLVLIGGCQY